MIPKELPEHIMSFLSSMKCTLTCCPNPKGNLLCLVHRVTLMSFFTFMITIDAYIRKFDLVLNGE